MTRSLKILLVEDNVLNQKITSFGLKKYNHLVAIANNGEEAVNMYQQTAYDVVLMDLMMPVMDGLTAALKIRDIEKEQQMNRTPIVAITANTLDNDRNKCIEHGMDDYMSKPFNVETLNDIFTQLNLI